MVPGFVESFGHGFELYEHARVSVHRPLFTPQMDSMMASRSEKENAANDLAHRRAEDPPIFRMLALITTSLSYSAVVTGRAAVATRGASPIMMAGRTPMMAGNWKMNTDLAEAVALAKEVAAAANKATDVDVAVCVPFPFLIPVKAALAGSKVGLGAQDCHWEEAGAYTGAPARKLAQSSPASRPAPPLAARACVRLRACLPVRTHRDALQAPPQPRC